MEVAGTVTGERARRTTRRLVLHSRVQLVVKATVAATLSWLVGGLVGGEMGQYRYYAPLGAVVMTYPTIARTVRQSWHGIIAIALGGALGTLVHQTLGQTLAAVLVVVAVGVGLAGLPFLGDQRSYVPVVALLVVVIGGSRPEDYALAYVAMSLLGAAIGVCVSLALPATRLSPGQRALQSLELLLAEQLHDAADMLRSGEPPGPEWEDRLRSARPLVDQMRRSVDEATDAQRGNPRARRRGYPASDMRQIARSLERVSSLVEHVLELVGRTCGHGLESSPLDRTLAAAAADALERVAVLVRSYHEPVDPNDERVVAGHQALRRLRDEFGRRRDMGADDLAVLGAVVTDLRRCLATVEPREAARRRP